MQQLTRGFVVVERLGAVARGVILTFLQSETKVTVAARILLDEKDKTPRRRAIICFGDVFEDVGSIWRRTLALAAS
jgi:hypothetical protein